MSLIERLGHPPEEIERASLEWVQTMLPPLEHLTFGERQLVYRIVRAEGDLAIHEAVQFSPGAVEKAVAALRLGAEIVTDARMVEAGISKGLLARLHCSTLCLVDSPKVAERAREERTTRSAAAIREAAPHLQGSVVAVGNAPTALLAVLDLVDQGKACPALIIGMPVGFVACSEAKRELLKRSVPWVTILGFRGGSSAAAATMNALLALAVDCI